MAANGRKSADAVLALALAGGATIQEAAKRADVSERTAFRRLADPTFHAEVIQLRGDMVSSVLGQMCSMMTKAVDTLGSLLEANSESVRLNAARAVLEMTLKIRESVEIENRVRELEAALELRQPL